MITIFPRTVTLSDGSKVHDVVIMQDGESVELHCVTERDADDLADKLEHLIEITTVDRVSVSRWKSEV